VEQWLSFVHTQFSPIMDDKLAEVNSWLAPRTVLVGTTVSLADIVLYAALCPAIVRPLLKKKACGKEGTLMWYTNQVYQGMYTLIAGSMA
jgi:hypothetical protein